MRWEDLYDELYDADDRAEIERLKTRLLTDLRAHRLAQARKSRGLTQRDVAAAMGLSVGRVSQIERGEVTSVEVPAGMRTRWVAGYALSSTSAMSSSLCEPLSDGGQFIASGRCGPSAAGGMSASRRCTVVHVA